MIGGVPRKGGAMAADHDFDIQAFLDGGGVGFEAVGGAPASSLSGPSGDERLARHFQLMQRGLVYPAPFARFVTVWEKDGADITRAAVGEVARKTLEEIESRYSKSRPR